MRKMLPYSRTLKESNRNRSSFIFSICLFAGIMIIGCLNDSKNEGEPKIVPDLSGEWVELNLAGDTAEKYVFLPNNTFQNFSYDLDSTYSYEGDYLVVDSMARLRFYKNGIASEEIWIRFQNLVDSMVMYKGLLFEGNSNTLIGDWKVTSSIPDSENKFITSHYIFTEDNLLLISSSAVTDTSRYELNKNLIQVYNIDSGTLSLDLKYEINENRLSLYNLSTQKIMHKIN